MNIIRLSVKKHFWLTVFLELATIVLGVTGDIYTNKNIDDCVVSGSIPNTFPIIAGILALLATASSLALLARAIKSKNPKHIILITLFLLVCIIAGLGSVIIANGANLLCRG